jgi:glycosyltransferase involved in cell wall biosynthesis
MKRAKLAAVIPCYKVANHVLDVVSGALQQLDHVFVVDDACPEGSGDLVASAFPDERVTVLRHKENRGVGAATVTGYRAALKAGYDVLVKIDGDGQMDLDYLPALLQPILSAEADYTKGNRFYRKRDLKRMPLTRIFGNSMLSVLSKGSTGYWNVMDPTNGFTALSRIAAQEIEWSKVSQRYFFESDLLFRLNIARAVVQDVPIPSRYGDENSNLRVVPAMPIFLLGHVRNFVKRFFYSYLVRDFSIGTVQSIGGGILFLFGVIFGAITWLQSAQSGQDTPIGTVMVAALPIILGFQLLLGALSFDIASGPTRPLQRILKITPRLDRGKGGAIPLEERRRA